MKATATNDLSDALQKRRLALAHKPESIWENPSPSPNPTSLPGLDPVASWLIEIIHRELTPAEGHQVGNDNKERELTAVLGELSPIEAFTLRRRLEANSANDELAIAFRRMIPARRQRLIAFVGDPKRRAALVSRAR